MHGYCGVQYIENINVCRTNALNFICNAKETTYCC